MKIRERINFPSPTIQTVWLILPLVISFVALNFTPLKEGDLWWQIKTGQLIYELGHVPPLDTYTFTAYGEPYYFSYSWLGDWLFYVIHKMGGLSALVLTQAVVTTATTYWILRESLLRGAPPALASALTTLGWIGLYPFSSDRPQIFSFLLFISIYTVISDYIRRQRNRLWLLPILMLLWVNVHGGWPIGIAILVLEIIALTTQKVWDRSGAAIKPLLIWGTLTLAVTLLNPEGTRLYVYVLSVGKNAVIQKFISEWQPLVITNYLSWAFFTILAIWICGLAFHQKKVVLGNLLTLLFLSWMSLRYLRVTPYFYTLAIPIVAETLAEVDYNAIRQRFSRYFASHEVATQQKRFVNSFFLIVLCSGGLISLPHLRLAVMKTPESSLLSPQFPIEAVNTLKQIIPDGSRIYSLAEWGGYLTWQLHPRAYIFADGRAELLPLNIWDDYVTIGNADGNWQTLLDEYRVDYLVLRKDRQARLILSAFKQDWSCLTEDAVSIILSRQPSAGYCPSLEKYQQP